MLKTKKKFSERWVNQFVKRFEGIKTLLHGTFVCHEKLQDAMIETYDYLFALAKAAKVTPKAFAKLIVDTEKLHEYSNKLVEEIVAMHNKAIAKIEADATKAKAKAEKVAKKKAK